MTGERNRSSTQDNPGERRTIINTNSSHNRVEGSGRLIMTRRRVVLRMVVSITVRFFLNPKLEEHPTEENAYQVCGLSSVRNLRCGLERHRIHLENYRSISSEMWRLSLSLFLSLSLSSGLICLSAAKLVLQTATYLCKNSQGIHGGKSTHAFPELFYMLVLQDRCISSNVETGDSKSCEIIFL